MPKIIVYDPGVATRLVINEFLSSASDFIHIVWTGDAFGNYKAYKNGVLAGTEEGDPAAITKRKYMWFGRLTLYTGFYLSDATYSYIRFWQDTILDSNGVQQLYKARSDIPTPSPTITVSGSTDDDSSDNDDSHNDDGPADSVVEIIGDATTSYWSITRNLFKDLWNAVF